MATLKVSTLNLNSQLFDNNVFTVKLDAWKQTFYYWGARADKDIVLLDGFNLADLSHDQYTTTGPAAGVGPLVLEFGGAFYKGKPIQLDDQITFNCGKIDERSNCRMLCVKQYFVEDRPGPDKTITDEVQRNLPGRAKPPANPAGPRTEFNRPGPRRGQYERPVRRGGIDR
jgi:hypothetical protein